MQKREGTIRIKIVILGCLLFSLLISGIFFLKEEEEPKTIKFGVAVYKGSDVFLSTIVTELEELITFKTDSTIKLNIADGRGVQSEQNEQVERFLSLSYDVLFVNLVDRTNASYLIDKAVAAGIPLIFFNREPVEEDIFRDENIYYVGSDAKASAILQGKMVLYAYEKNPGKMDKNKDGVLQYLMLEGEAGHQDTIIRTEYSVKTIEQGGVPMEKLAGFTADFERNQASALVEQWLEENQGESIELILSNNDAMALGALDALEKKNIALVPILGIDGIPEGIEAVDQGKMLGTSVSDAELYAKKLLELGYALAGWEDAQIIKELERQRYLFIPWKSYMKAEQPRSY